MRSSPQECSNVGRAMWEGEEISTQTQQLGLRPVYLCSLVVMNWIWKGRKNFVHEIFHLQVIFQGIPWVMKSPSFFFFF